MVRGASDDLPHLQGLVQPAQDRALEAGYEVEALQVELSKADGACAPLEQPALEARQRHAAIAQELAIARYSMLVVHACMVRGPCWLGSCSKLQFYLVGLWDLGLDTPRSLP